MKQAFLNGMMVFAARSLIGLVVTTGGLGLTPLKSKPIEPGDEKEPLRVACVGDSITYGYGIENREENSYPARLSAMLNDRWVVRNFGVSAATLLENGDKPYVKQKAYKKALKWEPDVMLIMLGTNDTKPQNWKLKEEFVADYRELVGDFREANRDARIFVMLPVPAFPGNWGIRDKVIREGVVPRVREVAKREDLPVIDLYKPFQDAKTLFPDKVHPNAEGAKQMAELIRSVLTGKSSEADGSSRDKRKARLQSFLGEAELGARQLFGEGRFPNVVVCTDGTVLATWGNKEFKVRRSEDGGESWGPEIGVAEGLHGGGVTVDATNGDVLAFVHPEHPPRDGSVAPRTMYRSTDHGRTWEAEDARFHKDVNGKVPSLHMSEHGITLNHGSHAGRLIRPARVFNRPKGYNTAIYSDNGGETWYPSNPFPEKGTGEGAIVELSDGTLYYNSRVHRPQAKRPTRRRSARSYDGGETWQDRRIAEALPDGRQDRAYGCMGGLVRLPVPDRDILIFSNLDTGNSRRERVTVWASFDGGKHWPIKRLVHAGPSAYSSLAAGRPGTASEGWIYLQFEAGEGGRIARFNLAWLLKGKRTGDGSVPNFSDLVDN